MGKFKSYEVQKQELLEKIGRIRNKICELESFGIDCSETMEKLEETVQAVQSEMISIVLVGSFSDGKTSVIAGWLGEKVSNMKIDSDESSDQLEIYTPSSLPDKCQVVDTPGLFGDKERDDDDGRTRQFSDITKKFSGITEKYIDQANIILYVVDAKNPLKESHREVVRWILKDLNKLSSTIFVINKMDVVADLTDEADFENARKIKEETLRKKIVDVTGLASRDAEKLQIVCISSNPNDKGFDFWMQHKDKYEARSRILDLEEATNKVLKDNASSALITKTGYDTLGRVLRENIQDVERKLNLIEKIIVPEMQESLKRNNEDFETARRQILNFRESFVQDINDYQKSLKTQLRTCTMETIGNFVRDEIGINGDSCGYKLEQGITSISQRYFTQAEKYIADLEKSIEQQEFKQNEIFDKALKKGVNAVSDALKGVGVLPLKNAIFAGRKFLKSTFNIGIKFKPWGVTKLANGLSKSLPLIGAGLTLLMEGISIIKKNKENQKFQSLCNDIETLIDGVFKEIVDTAQDEKRFFAQFAPQLQEVQEFLDGQKQDLNAALERQRQFQEWKKSAVDADFNFIQ
ncbi:MAG: dynamin family protein [Spirochaetaceae bacterium]|nr:dynamin family protein [Spirochaetaceae bacterium]